MIRAIKRVVGAAGTSPIFALCLSTRALEEILDLRSESDGREGACESLRSNYGTAPRFKGDPRARVSAARLNFSSAPSENEKAARAALE